MILMSWWLHLIDAIKVGLAGTPTVGGAAPGDDGDDDDFDSVDNEDGDSDDDDDDAEPFGQERGKNYVRAIAFFVFPPPSANITGPCDWGHA